MTAARVTWIPDDGEPIEFSANLTIRIVPDAPEAEPRCVLMDPPTLPAATDSGELTFARDDSVSYELPPQRRRFLVARWPGGLTKVREMFPDEAER